MKLSRITTVFLVSAVALILLGTTAYAKDKPDKPEPGKAYRGGAGGQGQMQRPGMQQRAPQMGQMQGNLPMLDSKACRAEMERHQKAVEKITEKTEKLRKELRGEIIDLREEYFGKFERAGRRNRPDERKIGAFMKEMKELIDEFTKDNERELKRISSLMFDERIKHMENMIKIMKKNKREVVEAQYKKVLFQPVQPKMRAIQQRRVGPWQREDSRTQPQWRGQQDQKKQGAKAAPMKKGDKEDNRPRWRNQKEQEDRPAQRKGGRGK